MRDIDVNLYDWDRLQGTFGEFIEAPGATRRGRVAREMAGESYARILDETVRLIGHQWREHIQDSAVKGFLFHGAVGVGKTTMAKRIAYELGRMFGTDREDAENEVVLVLVDGADIARGRYGDSEERLADLFEYAREGETHSHRFGVGPRPPARGRRDAAYHPAVRRRRIPVHGAQRRRGARMAFQPELGVLPRDRRARYVAHRGRADHQPASTCWTRR